MQRIKQINFFLLIMFFSFLGVSNSQFKKAALEECRYIALNSIPRASVLLDNFIGASLSSIEPIVFYDLNNNKSAYIFQIENQNKYVGYIAINTNKNLFPIVEYSSSSLPTKNINILSDKAKSELNTNDIDFKLIYIGGINFYIRFYNDKNKSIVFNLTTGRILNEKLFLNMNHKISMAIKSKQIDFSESWDCLKNNKIFTSYDSYKIYGVDAYEWYRGCYPTSLAMIINYFGKNNYPKLYYSPQTFSWDGPGDWILDYIFDRVYAPRELIDKMLYGLQVTTGKDIPLKSGETEDYGITNSDARVCVQYIGKDSDYNFDIYNFNYDNNFYYNIQNTVSSDIPVGLQMYLSADDIYHEACCIGYDYGYDHRIIYHTACDKSEHVLICENIFYYDSDEDNLYGNFIGFDIACPVPIANCSSDESSITMKLNGTKKINFSLSNNGENAGYSYLDVSISSDLEIIDYLPSSAWNIYDVGSEIWFSDGEKHNSSYMLVEVMENSFIKNSSEIYSIVIRKKKSGDGWIKYRAAC